MQQIMLVEDEAALVTAIRERFEAEGFAVTTAASGEVALHLLDTVTPELFVIDLGLPGMDGFELLRQLRTRLIDAPVIILTARGDEIDRVVGLELGADDYMVKPFSLRELVARVRVLFRRMAAVAALRAQVAEQPAAPAARTELSLDPVRRSIALHDQHLVLRPREFALFELLFRHPGQVFTREALLRQVWGQGAFFDTRTVDVHIRRLRTRLATLDPELAERLQTEWGVGYRFV
ncbi:response regulator transcription factor [Candidatus Chloroploca asiatica]|uniref:DNA-binding response regulator n=1 Tax=Candidatus Chloroploca asiatica TaxID=1506545 RepID=A0A2H3LC55_9CHLR|nr:response regulator transcription factor [Candidatus Chloroploca asiatica]PDW00009.1 DNA-binding response regulator [Candidatus Chloroploca asiatica]